MSYLNMRPAEGHIQLIFGPMFSGKTTEMLRRVNRYRLANRNCRIVKYKHDTRYAMDKVATHDQQMQEALSASKISEVMTELWDAQVIGIDDGQFFDDIAECSEKLANCGKIVIVAALDGDFNRKRFKNVLDLCPFSEDIKKLNAVCTRCGEDASFTKRLTSQLTQEVIGGSEMYTAVCRDCYFATRDGDIHDELHPTSDTSHGRIELILGPMFSGKTTEMLRRRNRHALASRDCRVLKYAGDVRYNKDNVVTHDQLMQEAVSAARIADVFEDLLQYKVIGIDEGQFFPDVVEHVERLANLGKIVIVAALDGDYSRKEFMNRVLDLCPLAEKVSKLRAVCTECGSDAAFSKRLTMHKDQEVIGGKEMYSASCRTCYFGVRKQRYSVIRPGRLPLRQSNSYSFFDDLTVKKMRDADTGDKEPLLN